MKLFKKLAAAMLVAALALTMVGCGGRNSLLDQVKDRVSDVLKLHNEEIAHQDDLDTLAGQVLVEVGRAYKDGDKIGELLENETILKAAGIENADMYDFVLIASSNYKSDYVNGNKVDVLANELYNNLYEDTDEAYGIAVGKVGKTEYILMVAKKK